MPARLHFRTALAGLAAFLACLPLLSCDDGGAGLPPSTSALNARYDEQTFAIMQRQLTGEATGIDVGSFRGDMLAQMVECAPGGIHYGFEPLPEFHGIIAKRFDSPKVKVFQLALGDEAGTMTFKHVVSNPAYSGFRERSYVREEEVRTIEVQVETLDRIIPPGARVDFIKVDVEGAEMQVLLGGRETIRRTRPVIVFEFGSGSSGRYGTTPGAVWAYLHDDLGMHLGLMEDWLAGAPPFKDAEEFAARTREHFYFIAYP